MISKPYPLSLDCKALCSERRMNAMDDRKNDPDKGSLAISS